MTSPTNGTRLSSVSNASPTSNASARCACRCPIHARTQRPKRSPATIYPRADDHGLTLARVSGERLGWQKEHQEQPHQDEMNMSHH
jgi:hypothetical protein